MKMGIFTSLSGTLRWDEGMSGDKLAIQRLRLNMGEVWKGMR